MTDKILKMKLKKKWYLKVNQKGNYLWEKGKNPHNPLWLSDKYIWLKESTPYIKKEFKHNWEVQAENINPKTVYGKFRNYKTKRSAINFIKKYIMNN